MQLPAPGGALRGLHEPSGRAVVLQQLRRRVMATGGSLVERRLSLGSLRKIDHGTSLGKSVGRKVPERSSEHSLVSRCVLVPHACTPGTLTGMLI